MPAMTLIVDRRGACLDLGGPGVVRVRYDEDETHRVGLHGLRRIVLQGDAQVSASLLRACSEAGIGLVLAAGRGRSEPVQIFPAARGQVGLRLAQYRYHADLSQRLVLARKLVMGKIEHQALWLEAHGVDAKLKRFAEGASQAPDLATLMGMEGAASARYFAVWGTLWQVPWSFNGRNRRPPRAPINALLSLGYALALNYVGRMAALRGLDLAIGFLHAPQTSRPALALDLLEPLRPWADQWVWQLGHSGRLRPDHFTYSQMEGCRLDKEARAVFFDEWHGAEDEWLKRPARNALALVLKNVRLFMNGHLV
jgi:CRISP-associated protein Cas1